MKIFYSFLTFFLLYTSCLHSQSKNHTFINNYYSQLNTSTDILEDSIYYCDSIKLELLNWDITHIKSSVMRLKDAELMFFDELFNEKEYNRNIKSISNIDIAPMLTMKLYHNESEIIVEKHPYANRRGAIAECVGNQQKIFLPLVVNKKSSPYAPVFFKFHEYAHIKLGHTPCSGKKILNINDEISADCLASQILIDNFGKDGQIISHHMAGIFIALNNSRNGNHPSTYQRGISLIQHKESCE
jgi:hypothetical protein